MASAPEAGTPFAAFLASGRRVRVERADEGFVDHHDGLIYTAAEFLGWLPPDDDGLTERQRFHEDHAEQEAEDALWMPLVAFDEEDAE